MIVNDDKIIIIPKPNEINWGGVTKLLNVAFSTRKTEGLNFPAATITTAEIISKYKNSSCLIALDNKELVGVIIYKISEKQGARLWFYDTIYINWNLLAVHPKFKNRGIGNKLIASMEKKARENNVDSIIGSTAAPAKALVNWYSRIGYKKISYGSDITTNYYSIIFQKKIKGEEYNIYIRLMRFYLRKLMVLIGKNRNGQFRIPYKYLKK